MNFKGIYFVQVTDQFLEVVHIYEIEQSVLDLYFCLDHVDVGFILVRFLIVFYFEVFTRGLDVYELAYEVEVEYVQELVCFEDS